MIEFFTALFSSSSGEALVPCVEGISQVDSNLYLVGAVVVVVDPGIDSPVSPRKVRGIARFIAGHDVIVFLHDLVRVP